MAIAFDATSLVDGGTSVSHTCTGSNLILFAGVSFNTADGTITGATYNGVGMTEVTRQAVGGVPGTQTVALFYLVAPATGSNTLAVTGTASAPTLIGSSYTGAKQTGIPDASASTNSASATSISQAVTTVADNSWVVAIVRDTAGTVSNTGSVSTSRDATTYFWDTNAAKTPAGGVTASYSGSSGAWAVIVASFAPFTIASTNHSLLMGV